MEPYYYSQMNKTEQSAYHAMKTGLTALAPSYAVPRLKNRELADIFFKLRLDCPELFYGTGFHYRFYQNSGSVEMIPEYLFDKGKVKEHQKAMSARTAKLVRPAESMTEWEKERYIHDFICTSVRYDKLKKPYSHEIIGPLQQGVGVCEGIAKTVKLLCGCLGIECVIAVSEAAPDRGIRYRHAWNVLKMGGNWYHLDATFDNSLGRGETIRYDYFNLGDKQLFRDHESLLYQAPPCSDGDHFYYREKKLSFTKTEDVAKRAAQAVKKGKPLIFHWRGGYLTKEVLKELLELIRKAGDEKDKTAMVSINWPQAVIRVQYTDMQVQESVTIEEANEGEK